MEISSKKILIFAYAADSELVALEVIMSVPQCLHQYVHGCQTAFAYKCEEVFSKSRWKDDLILDERRKL